MIYSDEDIYYALELRFLSKIISGTLCVALRPMSNAHNHWNTHLDNEVFTNPWSELNSDILSQIDSKLFRVFADLNKSMNTVFTYEEVRLIIKLCKRFNCQATLYKNKIGITPV